MEGYYLLETQTSITKTGIDESARLRWLLKSNDVDDNRDNNREFIKGKLLLAWKALRQVQMKSIQFRDEHLAELAQHYALQRNPSKEIEIQNIGHVEKVIRTSKKQKWYLKERHGMIRTFLVPDFQVHHILAIFGALVWTVLMQAMVNYGLLKENIPYIIVVLSVM